MVAGTKKRERYKQKKLISIRQPKDNNAFRLSRSPVCPFRRPIYAETVKDRLQTSLPWNTNKDLYTPYSRMSFWMTSSDLAKYSMTRSIARPLCDSWPSCTSYLWNWERHPVDIAPMLHKQSPLSRMSKFFFALDLGMLLISIKLCLVCFLLNIMYFWEKLDFCYVLRILITWFVRYFSTTHLVK